MKNTIIAKVIRQTFISKVLVLIAFQSSAILFAQSTPYDSYEGPFMSISAGSFHSVALKEDGTIVQWGNSRRIPPADPAGTSPGSPRVKTVSAGLFHTVALKEDGTVMAWGKESYGTLDIPADITNVKAISGGKYHTAAVKEDGTVVEWGGRDAVEKGGGVPEGLTNVKAVAAGRYFTIAQKENGTVVAWGKYKPNIPADLVNVISITAGEYYAAALKEDGTVVMLGNYKYDPPAGLTNIKAIAAGIYHMLALREDGTVVGWKAKEPFQQPSANHPIQIPAGLKNVKAIDAGKYHAMALKENGSVVLWGSISRNTVNILKQPENRQAGKHKGRLMLSENFLYVPKNAVATLYNLKGRILAQWTAGSEYELDQTAKARFNGIYIYIIRD